MPGTLPRTRPEGNRKPPRNSIPYESGKWNDTGLLETAADNLAGAMCRLPARTAGKQSATCLPLLD